jgi:hypothetical protein
MLFTGPTVAALAEAIGADPGVTAPIPVVPRDRTLPLSFAQQRLWFLDEFEPGGTEYVTPLAVRLRGRLDTGALDRAMTALVARHESLRTTFRAEDGRAEQIVHPPTPVRVPVREVAATDLDAVLERAATTPFDLGAGPLLRPLLLRVAPDDHVLALTMHHIVTDGWSGGVIMADLAELYRAELTATEPDLPELSVQYADFAPGSAAGPANWTSSSTTGAANSPTCHRCNCPPTGRGRCCTRSTARSTTSWCRPG